MDFLILTDVASKYATTTDKPESTDVVFSIRPDDMLILRVRFSGADFDLERVIVSAELLLGKQIVPAVMLPGKTLKGGITMYRKTLPPHVLVNRPTGTFVIMRFPNNDDTFLLKTFVFS